MKEWLRFMSDEQLRDTVARLERQVASMAEYGTALGRRLHAEYQAKLDAAKAELERRNLPQTADRKPRSPIC